MTEPILKYDILMYLKQFCYGHKKARHKEEILKDFPTLNERKLREYISELIHENHVMSDIKRGVWFVMLNCDREEAEAVFMAIRERKGRAMSILTGLRAFEQEILDLRSRKEDKLFLISVLNGQMSWV